MKKNIIYIAGLYHSGSTLLDRVLSLSNETLGLGEIYKLILDGPEKECSCGLSTKECNFWKELQIDERCNPNDNLTIEKRYKKILKKAKDNYSEIKYIIDSSKCHPMSLKMTYRNFKGLLFHTKDNPHNLKVIHLYRDPRGWVNSILAREERFKRNNSISFLYKTPLLRILRWLQWGIMNRRIRYFIKSNNLEFINISYEELNFSPFETIQKINKFTGLNLKIKSSLELKTINSHICVGNPSRVNKNMKKFIRYDSRWISSRRNIIDDFFTYLYWQKIKKFIFMK